MVGKELSCYFMGPKELIKLYMLGYRLSYDYMRFVSVHDCWHSGS